LSRNRWTPAGGCTAVVCMFLMLRGMSFSQDVVVVEHADSLVGKILDGQEARELVGNVRIVQGNVRITCDRALQFLRTGKVLLDGNVVVQDDSVTLRAPRGSYDQTTRSAEGHDGVSLDDGSVLLIAREGWYNVDEARAFFRTDVLVREQQSTILADSLTYFRTDRVSVAEGNVRVFDTSQDLVITGTHLDHRSAEGYSRMTGNPLLVQFDSTADGGVDTLIVRSRVMESYRSEGRRLVATDSVRIVRTDLSAIAGLAMFFPDGDSILLRQEPVVWYDVTQVTGDSIDIFMNERRLDHVDVTGSAFGVSRTDTLRYVRYDQLSGDLMHLRFVDRRLHQVLLERRATSVYHLFEDSLANGLNQASGDRIVMGFEQGKVSAITVFGGVEGEYVPENIVFNNESAYHLPGFTWRDDRPLVDRADEQAIERAMKDRE